MIYFFGNGYKDGFALGLAIQCQDVEKCVEKWGNGGDLFGGCWDGDFEWILGGVQGLWERFLRVIFW